MYEFKGWIFEYGKYTGAWPLKKDLEPRARAGRVFYKMLGEFLDLPEIEREEFRVGGGCQPIGATKTAEY